MFISKQLAYVELHKTGGTHIIRQLRTVLPEGKHGAGDGKHTRAKDKYIVPGRAFLGSVRNPWDWYVSLWAYGCGGKGILRHASTRRRQFHNPVAWLTHPLQTFRMLQMQRRFAARWEACYRDAGDAAAFRDWLRMVHDPACMAWYDVAYGRAPLSAWAGFMSYRYLDLYCRKPQRLFRDPQATLDSAFAFERDNCYIDHFVRNEQLEDDLVAALRASDVALSADQEAAIRGAGKTNSSSRKGGVDYYYDAATLDLVTQREQFIIRRFGYQVPVLAG